MSKRKILIAAIAALFLAAAVRLFAPAAETFRCDRCHREVTEKPIHICEQTVDVTVCSDCYQDYMDGKWRICQN